MRKILIGGGALIVILIGLLLAAPLFLSVDLYKSQIVEAFEESTGRDIAIDGEVQLSLFPSAQITLEKIRIGNIPGGQADFLAEIAELSVGVQILPLFGGNVHIDQFVLSDPLINLELDAQENPNWNFSSNTQTEVSSASNEGIAEVGTNSDSYRPANLSLSDVRLVNGIVTYRDASGAIERIENINLSLSLSNLDSPLVIDGSATLRNEAIAIDVFVEQPRAILEGGATQSEIEIKSDIGEASFVGNIENKIQSNLSIGGSANLSIPSVRVFSKAVGAPIAGEGGFGSLRIDGEVNANSDSIAFQNAAVNFDGMTGKGKLTVNLAGDRPMLTGDLAVDKLDANAFMSASSDATSDQQASGKPVNSGSNDPQTQSPAAEWSMAPIDFSALASFNANLKLSAGQIVYEELKIQNSNVALTIDNAIMTAILNDMVLYDGKGTGSLKIDARRPIARISSAIELKGVQALPLLSDAAEFDRLEGTGNFAYSISTSGKNERQLVRNLNGNGNFLVLDGAWRGVNLAAMARTVQSTLGLQSQQSDEAGQENVGGGQKTDFAELNATFVIQKGILKNEDLVLLNPFIRVTGKGNIRMPRRQVKYRLQPKLVATTEGQGGQTDASGLSVPILVEGTWDNLSYRPDFKGMLSSVFSPGAGEADGDPVQNIIKGVGQVFGQTDSKTDGESDKDEPTSNNPSPRDLFNSLLGGSKE